MMGPIERAFENKTIAALSGGDRCGIEWGS